MASMRRGFAGDPFSLGPPANANEGAIESSMGSASTTPTPCRNLRRERAPAAATWEPGAGREGGGVFMGDGLLVEEKAALYNLMHEGAHAVLPGGGVLQDPLDLGPVAEPDGRAGRIDKELPREVSRDLPLVVEQQPLEAADVREGPAVGQLAAAV